MRRVLKWVVMGVRGRTWRVLRRVVGRAASAAAPCESPLYLDDKEPSERTGEPNLTQWNGRMVMETAFNLHRRSLFVDSLASTEIVDQNGYEGVGVRTRKVPLLRANKFANKSQSLSIK